MKVEELRLLREASNPNRYLAAQSSTNPPDVEFGAFAQQIIDRFHPQRVLDYGCSTGILVAELRKRGVQAYGIDRSEAAIQEAGTEVLPYLFLATAHSSLNETYDLILCLQTLLELDALEAQAAIQEMCQHTSTILFSAAPLHAGLTESQDRLSPGEWAAAFARHHFYHDLADGLDEFSPWCIIFRKDVLANGNLLHEYEDKIWKLRMDVRARRSLAVDTHLLLAQKESQFEETLEEIQELHRQELQDWEERTNKLRAELDEVYSSRAWRFGVTFRKIRLFFFPHGSRQESWLQSLSRKR